MQRRDANGKTVEKNKREYISLEEGYKISTTNELGQVTVKQYNQQDDLTSVIYPDGSKKTYKYDDDAQILSETNENGVKTEYTYDTNGNRLSMTEAVGTPVERTTTYTYDQHGQMLVMTRPGNAKTTFTYDNHGNVATRTKTVDGAHSLTETYVAYDNMGNVLEYRDGRNNTWKRTYNAKGKWLSMTDPLNESVSITYDALGNRIQITNSAHESTQYTYTSGMQLSQVTDALDGIRTSIYNAKGLIVATTDQENKNTKISYNAQGKVSQIIDGAGNAIKFSYGAAIQGATTSKVSMVTYPSYTERYFYDIRGRRTQFITDLGSMTKHVSYVGYDPFGNVIERVDAAKRSTKYTYDSLNHITKITEPNDMTIQFVYDQRDNVIQVIDQKGVILRHYEYDYLDRKTKEIWPDGETFAYTYDANSNLIEIVDGNKQTTKYTYDIANQRVRSEYFASGSTVANKTVIYNYDSVGRLMGYDDGTTSAIYVYDALGRRTKETINYGAFSKTITTTYYKNGRKKSFTTPENVTYEYTYDSANRLASVTIPGQGTISYTGYLWQSPTTIQYPGGGVRTTQYDALLRPTRITNKDPAANSTLDQQYTYDISGNIIHKLTKHGAYSYIYDVLDRLTATNNPTLADEAYTYDGVGNRLTASETTGNWEYNNKNQLLSDTKIVYNYDANGNQTKKTNMGNGEVQEFVYNQENEIISYKVNSVVVATYYYDPFGRRLWKEVNGNRTYSLYAHEGMIAEYDSVGTLLQNYGYTPGSAFGTQPLFTTNSATTGYYQLDQLGVPQQLTTRSGAVVWSAQYKAFGYANILTNVVENDLRFPGQRYDSETGLNYNYFRNYDAEIGRYVTNDPIDLLGGLNTYGYVRNNPTRFSDPLGLYLPAATKDCEIHIIYDSNFYKTATKPHRQVFSHYEKIYVNMPIPIGRTDVVAMEVLLTMLKLTCYGRYMLGI